MDDPQFQQHGGPSPAPKPHWKRIHHSPFFWLAALCIMIAMTIYVMTDNLSMRPGKPAGKPMPALAP